MQFINKFKYKRKGHRIIKAFIKRYSGTMIFKDM